MSSTTTTTPTAAGASTCSNEAPNNDTTFPYRLYEFLELAERHDISHIVSWQPEGRSFRVHNPKEFVNLKEPIGFLHKKYSSFQRQLNIYGFNRITSGNDKNGYYHKHFVRRQEHLLHKILRVPTKKDGRTISRTSNEKVATESSVEAYASVLPTEAIQSTVPPRHDHGIDVRSESEVDGVQYQRIELLRQINRQVVENQLLQRENDSGRMYGQLLLNSNHPMTSVPQEASLLQMMQRRRTSISMDNDLSLALSQLRAQLALTLPPRNVELLRQQQLNRELTTTLLSLLPSRSAFRESAALSLPLQPVLWNEGTTRGHQLRSLDPGSVSSAVAAATNPLLQNQMRSEDQPLDRHQHELLANAIALLTSMGENWNSFQ